MNSLYFDGQEYHYFKLRDRAGPDRIFISKVTEFKNGVTGEVTSKRVIRKVFDKDEGCEIAMVNGELVLRSSPAGRDQIKAIVYDNDNSTMGLVLQKFHSYGAKPTPMTSFTFRQTEFDDLLEFLSLVRFIDLSNNENFQISLSTLKDMVLIEKGEKELLAAFKTLHGNQRLQLLEGLKDADLTKEDLDILSGRKDGLEIFRTKLFEEQDWSETQWQDFFESNHWIFGYGLDYRFLSILQREAAVSNVDLDGTNTAFGDFLAGSSDFTVLVEMKRPDTPLFATEKKRSRAWELSKDLLHAVSQILAQKAEWQIKSVTQKNYDDHGNLIEQRTHDPKCLLIIGSTEQFTGSDREKEMKYQTFELFRRDSRNVEILTYSELFERAYFIVNQKQVGDEAAEGEGSGDFDDDIPF
jgi:hypothetical protein